SVKKAFSYDEAEEICSEIITELYFSFLSAEKIYNLDGYVWRLSEHVYSKYVARKKKQSGVSLDNILLSYEDRYFADDDALLLKIRREITFLTKSRRKIVYSYYYENKSIKAISESMGIPAGTVKWHLNRAKDELKKGFAMERKIGKLGLHPVEAVNFGHGGNTGANLGPEFYMGDSLNLNIVYSVYNEPKTKEEISEELGVSLVYIDDRIDCLEKNGFLVRAPKKRYTTYVKFSPLTYSLEERDTFMKKRHEIARILCESYVPQVRSAIAQIPREDIYVPGGNREVFEAAAVFFAVSEMCSLDAPSVDISKYRIKTTAGGEFFAFVDLRDECSDPEYKPQFNIADYTACGSMVRASNKYPVRAYSYDTRLSSRTGAWKDNMNADFEYLYEVMTGAIREDAANAEKFARLRYKRYIAEDGKVNLTVLKKKSDDFFAMLPRLDEDTKRQFIDFALEHAEMEAKKYPVQMRDFVVSGEINNFIGTTAAIMVADMLYENGTFKPLTENEKITANLIVFSDKLPE
ncbi:MAG: sigma factor-like helix-turn-helix DNA-binding protein, partial [Clostridia bacterium]|nr:sigma factor-like helix-turn-helix DNA-binding protein [Clostridia bacterium]